ncbi:MAG: DUF3560 domain-containing protein [Dehalococcoidia bacterium]|jgi:hypothetical protein
MIPVIILSGDTYKIRHEIRALGGVWQHEEKQYIVPESKRDQVAALIGTRKIEVFDSESPDNAFEPLTGDALRAYRQAKADRKAERIGARAEKKSALAESLFEKEHRIADMIPFGQPVLCGHHSQRRHERDIERMNSLSSKACTAYQEGQHLARVAERLSRPVAIKGDAEARHEAHRQKIRESVKVGDMVNAGCFNQKQVLKINKKTLTVAGTFGGKFTIDMALVNL